MNAQVVRFRDYEKRYRYGPRCEKPAEIIILPVVRIERCPDSPHDSDSPPVSRRRRRLPKAIQITVDGKTAPV